MTDSKITWLAVVNPYAGSGVTMHQWQKVKPEFECCGIDYEERLTTDFGHAAKTAYDAAREGWRHFMAVGGDGTAHDVLSGIMKYVDSTVGAKVSDFFLSVIPIGSGNDWIKSHGIPKDPLKVIELIKKGSFKKQDVVRITQEGEKESSYMLNIGGIGLDAEVCNTVNRKKALGRKGKLLYVGALISNIITKKAKALEVKVDGKSVFKGKALSVAFGIGKYCGGGMRQCPEAVLDDGLLDYTIVPTKNLHYTVLKIWKVFTADVLKVKTLCCGRGKVLEVTPLSENKDIVESDGEIVAGVPVRLEVIGDQLNALSLK